MKIFSYFSNQQTKLSKFVIKKDNPFKMKSRKNEAFLEKDAVDSSL